MFNVCWFDNTFTEPSYHDDVLAAILSISIYTENIYKYLCRILPHIYNKFNRWILFLYNFDSTNILSESMNNWGWYRNYKILHNTSSFPYQTMLQIKTSRVGQLVRNGTKEANHRHRFHIPTSSSQTYLKKNYRTENTDIIW